MLKKKVEDLCNRQVEREGYSMNLYLAMASWAEVNGLAGVAGWMYAQAEEEKLHMLKFVRYINERGGKAIIPAFKKPPSEFKSVENMFREVLKHEQFVTASINEIVALTLQEKDFNTNNFLQWFVMEQVEEESSAMAILDKLNLLGKDNMYQFDRDIMSLRGTGGNPPAAE
ncbi:MAG: ferritin [Bacteroidales bacterium]|nr:ferritin [Bacteroidales bacterium]